MAIFLWPEFGLAQLLYVSSKLIYFRGLFYDEFCATLRAFDATFFRYKYIRI